MRILFLSTVLIAAVLAISGAGQTRDMAFDASYDVYWKGFRVFTSNISTDVKAGKYTAKADFYPRGFAKLFVSGKSDVVSTGVLKEDGIAQAREWRVDGRWDGEDSRRYIKFHQDGRVDQMTLEVPEDWNEFPVKPIPDELRQGPDPMSFLVSMLRAPWHYFDNKDSGADFQMNMIDGFGVQRYSLNCLAEDHELEEKKSRSPYAGKTRLCTIKSKQLAGFIDIEAMTPEQRKKYDKQKAKADKKREKRRRKAEKERQKAIAKAKKTGEEIDLNDTSGQIQVWFQYFEDQRAYIPVRAQLPPRMGRATLYLASLTSSLPGQQKAR